MRYWAKRHYRHRLVTVCLSMAIGGAVGWRYYRQPHPPVIQPTQAAYVWQRHWDPGLQEALQRQGPAFQRLIVLAAEVNGADHHPQIAEIPIAYPMLKNLPVPIGLAIRVNTLEGDYQRHTQALVQLAGRLLGQARAAGVTPSELQLDFDAPSRRLAEYARCLQALKAAIAPVPLVFTALPDWLAQPAFVTLTEQASRYVLQVHGLNATTDTQPPTLFDEDQAWRWIVQAEALGLPFSVALPTYGYRLVYTPEGRLHSVVAEGQTVHLPAGFSSQAVHVDPHQVIDLLGKFHAATLEHCQELIWFRLPTPADKANWSWPTLQAVMAGQMPVSQPVVTISNPAPSLYEIRLNADNLGSADWPTTVKLTWSQARLQAADGLNGYQLAIQDQAVTFWRAEAFVQPSTAHNGLLGWLRFDRPVRLQSSFLKNDMS